MNEIIKGKIDSMDYAQMLYLWRFAPVGHGYLRGEIGDYFVKRMMTLKDELAPGESAGISKRIGWDK